MHKVFRRCHALASHLESGCCALAASRASTQQQRGHQIKVRAHQEQPTHTRDQQADAEQAGRSGGRRRMSAQGVNADAGRHASAGGEAALS